jgi:hypothetical protein
MSDGQEREQNTEDNPNIDLAHQSAAGGLVFGRDTQDATTRERPEQLFAPHDRLRLGGQGMCGVLIAIHG